MTVITNQPQTTSISSDSTTETNPTAVTSPTTPTSYPTTSTPSTTTVQGRVFGLSTYIDCYFGLLDSTHSFHTRDMAFNVLFQIRIHMLWENFVEAVTLEAIQRFRLQKQHVQITMNVAVFGTADVMVKNGL